MYSAFFKHNMHHKLLKIQKKDMTKKKKKKANAFKRQNDAWCQ